MPNPTEIPTAMETQHRVQSEFETLFQRDYSVQAPDMRRLYENAKRDQWNVSKDIDWSTPVDLDRGVFADGLIDGYGSPVWEKLDHKTQRELNVEFSCWRISQLLHGEEGAMLACSQLVDETFAVGLCRMLAETSQDPLLQTISKKILADESRHMGFWVLGLPETIASLSTSDLRELEDFTAEACRLVLRGQFPREAFDRVGLSEHDIKEVERIRVENAKSNDYLYFRQTFRREMYTQVVSNMKKVGLMTERTAENLRKLGIDPNIDGRAATLESQAGA